MAGGGLLLSKQAITALFAVAAVFITAQGYLTSSTSTWDLLPVHRAPNGDISRRNALDVQPVYGCKEDVLCSYWGPQFCDPGYVYLGRSVRDYHCRKTCGTCPSPAPSPAPSPEFLPSDKFAPVESYFPPPSPLVSSPPPPVLSPPPPVSSPPPPVSSPPPPVSSPPPPVSSPPPPVSSPPPPVSSPPPPESSPPPPVSSPPPSASSPPPPKASLPPPKTSPSPPLVDSYGDFPPEHVELLRLVNEGRAENGKPPLCLNSQLSAASYVHSEDMGLKDYFQHDCLNGTLFWQRIQTAGYPMGGGLAENIAAGYPTVKDVYIGWKTSEGHWKNILGDFKHMGVGIYRGGNYGVYWTQDFGATTEGKCA